MSGYIDRQAAIDAIQKHRENVLGGYEYDEGVAFGYAAAHNHIIYDVIERLPTADVEPVKRGKWIETKEWGGRNFYCSECRFSFIVDTCMLKPMWNYCPNCGAKMEGEEEC